MEEKEPRGALQHILNEDTGDLLITKLTPPRLHPLLVSRPSLLARLDTGIEQKLTLISAPAGFGKTTLVGEWIASRHKQRNVPPVAWVSLDPGDNDPVRFWRYVLTAGKKFDQESSDAALALLNSPQPPFQAVLTVFINGISRLSSKAVLVLEDYHLISAAPVHETLTFFLDHLSPTLHLILMARSDPPVPLARMRARNELNEIRANDLRFSRDETRMFLDQALPLSLSSEMVARLADRTEGWVAALRLVSLAIQKLGEAGKVELFLNTFTGSHRPVMDFIVGDVFNAQPEPLQLFLLQTSVLSLLTGSLCDAITGRNDSTLILEQLERDNLFLVSLDVSQQWYRFHALFAEAIQYVAGQRIGKGRLRELSYEASVWFEAHGMLSDAIEAAISAQALGRAATLIERVIAPRLVQNEYHTLRRWIQGLPDEVLKDHPAICMAYAAAILFTSELQMPVPTELIQQPLQMAEEHWQAAGNLPKLGNVMAFRALLAWRQGDFPASFSAATQALQLLPEEEVQWRVSSLIFVGLGEMYAGRLNAARRALTQAQALNESAGNVYATISALQTLAEVYARQAALRQAAQFYGQAVVVIERSPMNWDNALLRKARALLGLGALSMEWNDLEAAQQYGSKGLEIANQIANETILVNSTIILARLQFIRGERAQAQEWLLRVAAHTINPLLLRDIQAHHALLALRSNDLVTARRWHGSLSGSGHLPRMQQEMEALIESRLLIAQGEAEEALRLLAEWLMEAQDHGRIQSVLEGKILTSLALSALGDLPRSRQALVEALVLAQPEGYRRIFLDEGQPLARLLQASLVQIEEEPVAVYARALLHTLAQEQKQPTALVELSPGLLIEPLSAQEQRVLRLLAAGHTNLDIAGELVISVNTVKTHVKNIYGKLGVNSREQARQAARHLKSL